jgi:Kef-type K+ transport system membrane component KefB
VGCVVPRNNRIVSDLVMKLEDITAMIFLPLYFTFSGLRTEIGLLNDGYSWGVCVLVIVVTSLSKGIGDGIGGKFICKLSTKEALCFGFLMQTKGLVALIVYNLGLDYGVISPKFFAVNIVVVIVSTFLLVMGFCLSVGC